MPNGRLIVFEGAEGVGKSTQLRLLAEWLEAQGRAVDTLREPGGTPLGDEIRRLLLHTDSQMEAETEALLFMASRAQLVRERMRPALEAGHDVLLDRFFLSTYAYQIAGRGLQEDQVRAANAVATGGLVPTLTLLLQGVSAEKGLARAARRGGHDRMERNTPEFHARVHSAFARYAEPAWQAAHPECGPIVSIDATGTLDDVTAHVRQQIQRITG